MGKNPSLREITKSALMLGMIAVLSAVEGMFPLPFHMRFGLSNVVTMYALFFIGWRSAFMLAGLKSLMVFLTRGPVAGLLSASGGICSLFVIAALAASFSGVSYLLISVAGAVAHNAAQLAVVALLTSAEAAALLLPLMAAGGVAAGSLTAALLWAVMPSVKNVPERAAAAGGKPLAQGSVSKFL
jgi:heptaprenyl diphosphate synthase